MPESVNAATQVHDSPLVATYQDDGKIRVILFGVTHTCGSSELKDKLREAIRFYAGSAAGEAVIDENNGDFNWGDAVSEMEAADWLPFGILSVEVMDNDVTIVDHDENFAV